MFGFGAQPKSKEEIVEDEIKSLEEEVAEVHEDRKDLDTRQIEVVENRRMWTALHSNIRAKLAVGLGILVMCVVVSSVWEKTFFLFRLTFTSALYIILGAFGGGWLLVHLLWPGDE